jgi:hypothetical protein
MRPIVPAFFVPGAIAASIGVLGNRAANAARPAKIPHGTFDPHSNNIGVFSRPWRDLKSGFGPSNTEVLGYYQPSLREQNRARLGFANWFLSVLIRRCARSDSSNAGTPLDQACSMAVGRNLIPPLAGQSKKGGNPQASIVKLITISKKVLTTAVCAGALLIEISAQSIDVKQTSSFRRIKALLDATPAIDTHDHLPPFDRIAGRVQTERGPGMTLFSVWQSSYYTWFNPLSAWPKSGRFEDWWPRAKHDFENARATSF